MDTTRVSQIVFYKFNDKIMWDDHTKKEGNTHDD